MDKLIRKIIKEFVNSKVSFEVIGNISNLINEDINPIDLNIAKSVTSARLKKINPFQGNFTNKRTGKSQSVNFKISPTIHYIERKFRLSDPEYKEGGRLYNPKIVDPDYLEGIDLIYNNRDKLAEQIMIGRIKDGDLVEITAADGSNYHMFVKFENHYADMKDFELILVTQIKGTEFLGKRYDAKIRLFPNPEK
jgi:hypothetical protein